MFSGKLSELIPSTRIKVVLTPSQVLYAIRLCELRFFFLNGIYATGWKSVQALKILLPAPTGHLTVKFKVFDMCHQGPLGPSAFS